MSILGSASLFLVIVDQTTCGSIVRRHNTRRLEFWKNLFGKLLAEFNSPLIVRVDVPDGTLSKDLVLIHGNQSAKSRWRQLVKHDRVGGSVAKEDLVGYDVFRIGSSWSELFAYLLLSLADH